MRTWQFSLVGLLAAVSFASAGCAALARPNEWWALAASNLSLAALAVAVLAAIYGHAARRAFWVGFAVVGWGYLAVGWANASLRGTSPADARPFIITRLLELLAERTLADAADPQQNAMRSEHLLYVKALSRASGQLNRLAGPIGPTADEETLARFMHIGHSLWAISLAVAGGLLARAFYYRRPRLAAHSGV